MKVLFFQFGSIVEKSISDCFEVAGIDVVYDKTLKQEKKVSSSQIVEQVSKKLTSDVFLFVFSVNYFTELSDVCEIFNVPYVCWTVDCPLMQLFSKSIHNKCNRIFCFDRAQYQRFLDYSKSNNVFYLPLGANVVRFGNTIAEASESQKASFASDISFVGSLYNEKNVYHKLKDKNMSEFLRGYIDGIEEAQMQVYGYNMIEDLLTDSIMEEFAKVVPDIRDPEESMDSKKYKIAHFLIGYHLAYKERITLLNALATVHPIDLYTLSDTSDLIQSVHNKGSANSYTEMPIIFNQSKINLNITMRPIMTGLSQRVFDVLACGGFLLTNYQEELPEMFEIGEEVECFSSKEELLEKTKFYLEHDELRRSIAEKGFERVKNCYTFEHRFQQMLGEVLRTM